jgi:hypothetical protein
MEFVSIGHGIIVVIGINRGYGCNLTFLGHPHLMGTYSYIPPLN